MTADGITVYLENQKGEGGRERERKRRREGGREEKKGMEKKREKKLLELVNNYSKVAGYKVLYKSQPNNHIPIYL